MLAVFLWDATAERSCGVIPPRARSLLLTLLQHREHLHRTYLCAGVRAAFEAWVPEAAEVARVLVREQEAEPPVPAQQVLWAMCG